jgi:hypothetical protein
MSRPTFLGGGGGAKYYESFANMCPLITTTAHYRRSFDSTNGLEGFQQIELFNTFDTSADDDFLNVSLSYNNGVAGLKPFAPPVAWIDVRCDSPHQSLDDLSLKMTTF